LKIRVKSGHKGRWLAARARLVISPTIPARTPGDFALDEDRVSIVCRNPDLAAERTHKGGDLLAATERDLTPASRPPSPARAIRCAEGPVTS
jgi:hypothetical protein